MPGSRHGRRGGLIAIAGRTGSRPPGAALIEADKGVTAAMPFFMKCPAADSASGREKNHKN